MSSRSIPKSTKAHHDLAATNGQGPDPAPAAEVEVVTEPGQPSASVVQQALSDDPLDLGNMRIDPATHAQAVGIKAMSVRVGRPDTQDMFRVHADPAFTVDTYLLHMTQDRDMFFVAKPLWADARVRRELRLYRLFYYCQLSGLVGIWAVPLPDEAGNHNPWHESAMAVAELAKRQWVRILSGTRGYSIITDESVEDSPVWPAMTFQDVINTAFRAKTITDLDHPKLKQLRVTTAKLAPQ
jgi:hypothetical protein